MTDKIIKHTWSYCKQCQSSMVICGTCKNNCCNAGYGEINGKPCPDCPSAYELQTLGWEKEYSTNEN